MFIWLPVNLSSCYYILCDLFDYPAESDVAWKLGVINRIRFARLTSFALCSGSHWTISERSEPSEAR